MPEWLYPITRGENPLHVFNNKDILAVGNPQGKDLKNTFSHERVRLTNKGETKLFDEEGLDKIDPKDLYEGGIARVKLLKRRHTSRKTNKQIRARLSKKRKSRRNNKKSKSKHTN
jgi:hypothetical protein